MLSCSLPRMCSARLVLCCFSAPFEPILTLVGTKTQPGLDQLVRNIGDNVQKGVKNIQEVSSGFRLFIVREFGVGADPQTIKDIL